MHAVGFLRAAASQDKSTSEDLYGEVSPAGQGYNLPKPLANRAQRNGKYGRREMSC